MKASDKLIVRIKSIKLKDTNEQYLLDLLNCWDVNFILFAIQSNALYTKVKYNCKSTELLIFYKYEYNNPIHYIYSDNVEIIPYKAQKRLYNNYDKNPYFTLQGTYKIDQLTSSKIRTLKSWIQFNARNKYKIKNNDIDKSITNTNYNDNEDDDSPISIINKSTRFYDNKK